MDRTAASRARVDESGKFGLQWPRRVFSMPLPADPRVPMWWRFVEVVIANSMWNERSPDSWRGEYLQTTLRTLRYLEGSLRFSGVVIVGAHQLWCATFTGHRPTHDLSEGGQVRARVWRRDLHLHQG